MKMGQADMNRLCQGAFDAVIEIRSSESGEVELIPCKVNCEVWANTAGRAHAEKSYPGIHMVGAIVSEFYTWPFDSTPKVLADDHNGVLNQKFRMDLPRKKRSAHETALDHIREYIDVDDSVSLRLPTKSESLDTKVPTQDDLEGTEAPNKDNDLYSM